MSFVSKEKELLNFIESKKLSIKKLNQEELLINLAKILKDVLENGYKKAYDLTWINECIHIIFHIYWVIIYYSFNIKLALFICDRALVLFNEYIDLAKLTLSHNSSFKIKTTDVKLFIYKRTIGPIKLRNSKYSKYNINKNNNVNSSVVAQINNIQEYSFQFKNILLYVVNLLNQFYDCNLNKFHNKEAMNEHNNLYIDYVIRLCIPIMYKLSSYNNIYIPIIDWNILKGILNGIILVEFDFINYLNLLLNITKINYDLAYFIETKCVHQYNEHNIDFKNNTSNGNYIFQYMQNQLNFNTLIINRHDKNNILIIEELINVFNSNQIKHTCKLKFFKKQKNTIISYCSNI